MLLEGIIVPDQLTFLIKLQPVFDRVTIQSCCLTAKCISNTCFCIIITCFQCRLQCRIILCNICIHICLRCITEIYRSLSCIYSSIQYFICFFDIQFTSHCFRYDHKLSVLICNICIFRFCLILCLGTAECLKLFLQLCSVIPCILGYSITFLFIESSDPLIWLLLFQKLQNLSCRKVLITDIRSGNRLWCLISG